MLFDTHCHLDAREFDADRDQVVDAARRGGVARVLVPAVAVGNFAAVRDCCARYPECIPAYGIHPLYVAQARPGDLDRLQPWLAGEAARGRRPVAVGEIGLDAYEEGADLATQEAFFSAQLRIAAAARMPVVLHVRRAVDRVLMHLRRTPVVGGIAHAFNGSRQQAEAFLALGFCLGFGGAMTYPGSTRIRELAATLPLSALVLETDAPDIPPVWLREHGGRGRNAPAELPRIARVLAELRQEPVEHIIEATTRNAARCLAGGLAGLLPACEK